MLLLIFIGKCLLVSLIVVASYSICTLLGAIIPVNTNYRNKAQGIEIGISSNGVHTDFILPTANSFFDWRNVVDVNDFENPLQSGSFVGVGWGDRGFYLDTPTWAELKAKTAIVAILIPSPTLVHITAHEIPPYGNKFYQTLYLTEDQYIALCKYIAGYFKYNKGKVELWEGVGYTSNDNFYTAVGSYHAFNTCNFWVNKGLIRAGVRTALWSPLDRGMFYQLAKIKTA